MGTFLKMQVFIAVGSLLVTYLLVPQGLVLMTKGIVVFSLLSLPILIAMVARKTKIRLWHDGVRLWAPLAASVVMAATLYFYDNSAFIPAQRGLHLLIDVVMGCFMYGVASFAFQFREALALIKIIKDRKSLRLLNKEAGVIEDDIGRKL
jgi:hypothetical protein